MPPDIRRQAFPEWTEYRAKNGIDPLGMQVSSIWLYQLLMPGISNVTLRIRYYGLYAWLVRAYAKRVGDTDTKRWQKYVRRMEALYALVAQHGGGETGVAGVTWAQRVLYEGASKTVSFADAAEPYGESPYLQQPWGAFGAAYAAQLHATGIFADAGEHGIPVPSATIGDAIADAFESALGPLSKRVIEAVEAGSVSKHTLTELRPMLPSGIPNSGSERKVYEDVLFANAGLTRQSDLSRKQSLLLLLELAKAARAVPDVQQVRWAFYDATNDALSNAATEAGVAQRNRWWAYQANDLSHVCYEALLKALLDRLEPHRDGIPHDLLISRLVDEIDRGGLDGTTTWDRLVTSLNTTSGPATRQLLAASMRAGRTNGFADIGEVIDAIKMLAVVYGHVTRNKAAAEKAFMDLQGSSFRSVVTEWDFLTSHATVPLRTLLARLIEQRIVRRHLWVAMRKLRQQGDYTFLFEVDNGRVRLRDKDGPTLTNPRLATAISFLEDIHLIDRAGITPAGSRVLAAA